MSKQIAFTTCPRPDCDGQMVYTQNEAACTKGHQFDLYAHGALLEIVGPDFKRGDVQYVHPEAFMTLIDRGARLWNAFVNYTNDRYGKFQGKLLDIAIELRDEAKEGKEPGYTTQMDYEVDRLKADGWRSYEGHK